MLGKSRFTYTRMSTAQVVGFSLLVSVTVPLAIGRTWLTVGWFGLIALLMVWRNGITIDTAAGTVSSWSGPFFPVVSTTYAASEYAIVSVMEDSVEVFNQRGQGLTGERRYASSLGLKLQPRLTVDMRFPDELPPSLTLRTFGTSASASAKAEGEAIAARLGLEFRSDV